jgi:hypothetical protein
MLENYEDEVGHATRMGEMENKYRILVEEI